MAEPTGFAERAVGGLLPPVFLRRGSRRWHFETLPEVQAADAVLVPSLHGPAEAGASIFRRAGELVVMARHRIEHEGRHRRDIRGARRALPKKVIDYAGQGEARAGARISLIHHRQFDPRLKREGGRTATAGRYERSRRSNLSGQHSAWAQTSEWTLIWASPDSPSERNLPTLPEIPAFAAWVPPILHRTATPYTLATLNVTCKISSLII